MEITGILRESTSMELVITACYLLVTTTYLKNVYSKQTEIQDFRYQDMTQQQQLKIYGHQTTL